MKPAQVMNSISNGCMRGRCYRMAGLTPPPLEIFLICCVAAVTIPTRGVVVCYRGAYGGWKKNTQNTVDLLASAAQRQKHGAAAYLGEKDGVACPLQSS